MIKIKHLKLPKLMSCQMFILYNNSGNMSVWNMLLVSNSKYAYIKNETADTPDNRLWFSLYPFLCLNFIKQWLIGFTENDMQLIWSSKTTPQVSKAIIWQIAMSGLS